MRFNIHPSWSSGSPCPLELCVSQLTWNLSAGMAQGRVKDTRLTVIENRVQISDRFDDTPLVRTPIHARKTSHVA